MAFTNTDTNMTNSTGVMPGSLKTYYDRKLLQTFEPELIHMRWGMEIPLPENAGTTVDVRKMVPIPTNTDPLSEGNPGDAILISQVNETIPIAQYGEYGRYTDKLLMTHLDVTINGEVPRYGAAGGRTVDVLCRDALANCSNVIYANKKAGRTALTASDKLTSVELRRAVKMLKKAQAQKFDGYYIAIVGPDTLYDLQEDDAFLKVAQYQDKENIYTGEVGRLYGCRIIESTEAKIFEKAGASNADVASTIVMGKYAYGYTGLKGKGRPHVIVKSAGSAGTADPLDQISTIGWKVDAFGVKVLQPEYAVRIEHGFTA